MLADNFLGWEIVLKISYLPSKLRLLVKYSFFGQSLSCGHYQLTYQPPKGVYLLFRADHSNNNSQIPTQNKTFNMFEYLKGIHKVMLKKLGT